MSVNFQSNPSVGFSPYAFTEQVYNTIKMVRIVMNRGVEGLSTCNIIQTGIRLLHVRFNAKIVIGNVLPLEAILLSDYPGSKRYLY